MDTPTNEPAPAPAPEPVNPPQPAAPEPPPAAVIVKEGDRNERTVQLERELEQERSARRTAETKCSEAEDEARRLRESQAQRQPRITKPKRPWYDLPTLLDDD
jgi:hypothetical protein